MKRAYLYIITLDNKVKYFINEDDYTYNKFEAKMFSCKSVAQKKADKLKTMWKVGVTYIPDSIKHLYINDIKKKP